jgi:hypothetical protein
LKRVNSLDNLVLWQSQGLPHDENGDRFGLDTRKPLPADNSKTVYVFKLPEDGILAGFLAAVGLVHFGIGAVLIVMHDCHMAKRTRAGRE